jgi:2'-5' RNA ligase
MAAISNERNSPNPDQIIVGLLRDVREGDTFERIPEHVTLLHWFSLNTEHQEELVNSLIDETNKTSPLELIGEGRELFGPDKDIAVTTLRSDGLSDFHNSALNIVQQLDGSVHSEYIGDKYAPHISDTTDFQYGVGETKRLQQIQLISMDRVTGLRKVEKIMPLNGGKNDAPEA